MAVRRHDVADATLYGMLFTRFYFGAWDVVARDADRINDERAAAYRKRVKKFLVGMF